LAEQDCRTVAIEVGLQNGGMAASLATEVLKKDAAAIAPALFAPVMNVSGSILAAIWSRQIPKSDQSPNPKPTD
jgi:BASS family bile acid:Na+ symporter